MSADGAKEGGPVGESAMIPVTSWLGALSFSISTMYEDQKAGCVNPQPHPRGPLMLDNPIVKTNIRHINISDLWLRQENKRENIKVQWTDSNHMKADGFTKPLPKGKFQRFIKHLGMEAFLRRVELENADRKRQGYTDRAIQGLSDGYTMDEYRRLCSLFFRPEGIATDPVKALGPILRTRVDLTLLQVC